MITLDAGVLIGLLDPRDTSHGRAVELMSAVADDFDMSAITRAEVLAGPARANRADEFAAVLDGMSIEVMPVTSADAVALAELRASTGLKLPDCCVLLVAAGSGSIATFDDRLASAARARAITVLD